MKNIVPQQSLIFKFAQAIYDAFYIRYGGLGKGVVFCPKGEKSAGGRKTSFVALVPGLPHILWNLKKQQEKGRNFLLRRGSTALTGICKLRYNAILQGPALSMGQCG